jgi:hypothetical protein
VRDESHRERERERERAHTVCADSGGAERLRGAASGGN